MNLKSIYNWYGQTLRNPKYRWWIILGTLVYLVSPLDISPDFIPIAGQIDDVMLLTLFFTEVFQLVQNYLNSFQTKEVAENERVKETIDVDAVSVD